MTARAAALVASALATALAAACGFGEVALDGKACDASGHCAQGYTCDRESNVCVRVSGSTAVLADGAVVTVAPDGALDPGPPPNGDGGVAPPDGSQDGATPPNDSPAFAIETSPTTAQLNGVTVSVAGFAVAVGQGGTIVRRDGQGAWSKVTSPTTTELMAVTSDGDDVWAVGRTGTALRSTNGGVTFESHGLTTNDLNAVAIFGGMVYVAGANDTFLNGPVEGTLTPVTLSTFGGPYTMTGIWPESASKIHFVSLEGYAAMWLSGGGSGGTKINASFTSVHSVAGSEPFATGHGDVYSFANGYASTHVANADLRSIWLKSASTMFVVGDVGSAFRRLGSNPWTELGTGTLADLRCIHGAGSLILAVGADGTILRLK